MNDASLNPVTALLGRSDPAILDGGLATELERRGHDLSDAMWSARLLLDDPEALRDVHADYLDAGADVVVSASYQATVEGFSRLRDLDEGMAQDLIRRSVRLACEARGDRAALVAASVGPYGAALADGSEYTGSYDLDEDGLFRWHRDRFSLLAGSGADLLAIETIPSITEARALVRLLDGTPHVPAWFSFSCRDGSRLADDSSFAAAVAAVAVHPRVVAVGVNCTAPRHVEELVGVAAERTSLPIVAYPNSGETWDPKGRCWTGAPDPVAFADQATDWRAAGARLIGGCCRTGPDHVRHLRQRFAEPRS